MSAASFRIDFRHGAGRVARVVLLAWLAAGCASKVVLDHQAPVGFDLNGTWVLDPAASDGSPDPRQLRGAGFAMASAVRDFPVLVARRMHIEQNRDSMGVRYDTGDYRDVSWGERTRGLWEVNAGWEEGQLLILSKARDARAEETIVLLEGGRRLAVRVAIQADDSDLTVDRQFTREP